MGIIIILVTVPNVETGRTIALKLVEEKLAACVNLVPAIESIYSWEQKIQQEPESLMVIKSQSELISRLERRVHELHPYTTPEFVVLESSFVSEKYSRWLIGCLQ
ncbi:MAG: divalent-cation tolerance protein CutA [Deltaproteobacteria bacterium]|nr:divalent-cation tolerance protein CutA [Deltaproteobacteria bacterium]